MLPAAKLLRHRDRIDGIVSGKLQPPVMVDVDPVNGLCSLSCLWCCQSASRNATPRTIMPVEIMRRLGPFCREWGVKSWRIASDSEPLLNKDIGVLLESGAANGIHMGVITHGVYLERLLPFGDILSWVGVSLDATTEETWMRLKGGRPGEFHKIIENLRAMRARWPGLDLSIKFLRWSPQENLTEADFGGGVLPVIKPPDPDTPDNHRDAESLEVLAEGLGIRAILKDAYPKDMAANYRFTKCRVTPLGGVFHATKTFSLCCDARNIFVLTDDYTRDNWSELHNLWGSEKHLRLIDSIDPKGCAGCAKRDLNELLEHVVGDTPETHAVHQSDFV